MDYQQLCTPCDWLSASVVMVFIPTDGHGYCGNSSRISIGSITGKNMLNTPGTSLHHHFSLTLSDIWRWEVWALTSIKSRFLKALNLKKTKNKKKTKLAARPKSTKTPEKKTRYMWQKCSNTKKSSVSGFYSPFVPSEITRVSTAGLSSSLAPEWQSHLSANRPGTFRMHISTSGPLCKPHHQLYMH